MPPPCDQCYTRRVKCRGQQDTCDECSRVSLQCTRFRIRKKRGPKPSAHSIASRTPKDLPLPQTLDDDLTHEFQFNMPDLSIQTSSQDDSTLPRQRKGYLAAPSIYMSDMTVNDLANSILGNEEVRGNQTEAVWLTRLQNSNSLSPSASLYDSPSLVRPTIWIPEPNDAIQSLPTAQDTSRNDGSIMSPITSTFNALDGTSLALSTGLPLRYGSDMIHCIDSYFSELHHVLLVVHEPSLRRKLTSPPQMTIFQRSLFLSICSVVKLKKWCTSDNPDASQKEAGLLYLERCLLLRSHIGYMEEQSPLTVVASYLLHLAHACLNKPKSARFYMQEAICQALDMGFQNRLSANTDTIEDPDTSNNIENICAQRALALLFVTERATVILNDCATVLLREPPTIPKTSFDERDQALLGGFKCLFDLFALLDTDIMEYWCSRKVSFEEQRTTFSDKLKLIQEKLSMLSFEHTLLDYSQKADILVTHQWLRLICWQISMQLGLLSSRSSIPAFSYNYPTAISADLCKVLESLPEVALKVHHFSIYCKIFEVAYALMDVLKLARRKSSNGESQELITLFRYLSTSPINNMRFARILIEKERNHSNGSDWTTSIQPSG